MSMKSSLRRLLFVTLNDSLEFYKTPLPSGEEGFCKSEGSAVETLISSGCRKYSDHYMGLGGLGELRYGAEIHQVG